MVERNFLFGEGHRIAPVVVLVVALHAALLAVPVKSARPQGLPTGAATVHVRMLNAASVSSGAAVPAAPSPVVESVSAQAPSPPVAPAATQAAPQPAPTADAAAAALVEPPSVSPPQPPFGLVVPGIDSDADYFPRAMLSLVPAPIDVVVIDYPPIPNDSGHHVSELTLFIDETGRVARVRVDGDALPPALAAAARAAFVNARFRAGEAAGQAVKSQIRVEVVFDNRPIDRP